MINWSEIRKQFPVFDEYIYLNAAGGSPLSLISAAAAKQYYDEMLREGDLPYEHWLLRTEETRQKLANLINALPSEIGFTPNTSTAMNLISTMLKADGEILTMRDEFPSTTIPWLNKGFKVRFVEPAKNFSYPVELIEKHVNPDTRILITSYVQYRTGFRQDLEAVGNLCRKKGLVFVVNATQGIGVMPLDVRSSKIDFMALSGVKWMASGYGIGAIFILNDNLRKYSLPFAGWRSAEVPFNLDNYNVDLRNAASSLESGTPPFPTIFTLGGALDLISSIGTRNIYDRILYLVKLLVAKLRESGLPVILPASDINTSGIIIIKTDYAKEIVSELARKKIIVTARGEGVRVSLSFFNNEEDINVFITELKKIKSSSREISI